MTEADRRQRVISSTPHLTPDEISARVFGTAFRGYAENEVRSFLKRVSEELAAARAREGELANAVDELEAQLRTPRPLSEQELLDALGEETARLLRSARSAGDDIRTKAEERAASVIEEAQTSAEQMRTDAAEILAIRTQEAETRAAQIDAEADTHASGVRQAAEQEAGEIVENARRQGRDMLDEAKGARERVLADLVRRRALLQAQVEELRSGRDRLLDAYRVVKRTFLEATEALAQVEARAAAERAAPTISEPIDIEAEVAAEVAALDARAAIEGDAPTVDETGGFAAEGTDVDTDLTADAEGGEGAAPDRSLSDVDSLFARIRAGQGEDDAGGESTRAEAAGSPAATARDTAIDLTELAEPLPVVTSGRTAEEWRKRRAEVIDPLVPSLVKRSKRTAQDDQNALLDGVRRHKGRPTAAQVLPSDEDVQKKWGGVLRAALDTAYGAGRTAAGGEPSAATDELADEAAAAVVFPLRERLTAAIDSGDEDATGLVERIGARYREWKNQSLERALQDALSFAWSRGAYDASPDGAVLQWIPLAEGRCSDCDDNALEPTIKGQSFPTGQPYPPAHPGCRCLLVPQ
jgi:DivIVA domain-containing protein